MARQEHVKLIDDLDGTLAAETVKFGLDGHAYEIDLSKKHAAALRKALAVYATKARRTENRRQLKTVIRSSSRRDPDVTAEIRRWAKQNGMIIGDRGRIPESIVASYARNSRSS